MHRMPAPTSLRIHRLELPTPFSIGTVNAYLLQSDRERILVDCGPKYPAAREALLTGLAARGFQPRDMTGLLLTHGHVDHVGLAQLFQSEGVPVYAPPGVDTWLTPAGPWDEYRSAFYEELYRYVGVPDPEIHQALKSFQLLQSWNDRSVVDITVPYNEPLSVLPNFQVLHVPGHAQHALALWDADSKTLFAGDQVLQRVTSNPLVEPEITADSGRTARRTRSLLQYRDNLNTLLDFEIEQVYPGHGEPFTDVTQRIGNMLSDQERRKARFRNFLADGEAYTAYELAIRYFPRHKSQLTLILSETIGYLDWLTEDGVFVVEIDAHGIARWRQAACPF